MSPPEGRYTKKRVEVLGYRPVNLVVGVTSQRFGEHALNGVNKRGQARRGKGTANQIVQGLGVLRVELRHAEQDRTVRASGLVGIVVLRLYPGVESRSHG